LFRSLSPAKVSAVLRLPKARRLATLVAFIHTLEASAQDDAIWHLEMLLTHAFVEAKKNTKRHVCPASKTSMNSPSRSLMLASP
jgi:hypothetical protein